MGNALPHTLDDLTADWFAGVLGRPVATVSIERIGVGVGILAQLARATLDDGTTYVVKYAAEHDETRGLAKLYGFYTSETGFYRDMAARDLGLRVPACHHVALDDEGERFALVMEDLGGATVLDQLDGCPIDRAERVVDALAAFHARWWNHPDLASLEWLRPINNPLYKAGQAQVQAVLDPFEERFAGRYTPEAFAIGRRWAERMPDVYDELVTQHPVTVSHFDLRLDNLFFDLPDGSPLAVLDWQLSVRGPGTLDVAYFLGESLTIDDRRAHERSLVQRYHRGLVAAGVAGYDAEQCWEDYVHGLVVTLSIPMVGSFMPMANDRAVALVETMVDRAMTAVGDHAALGAKLLG